MTTLDKKLFEEGGWWKWSFVPPNYTEEDPNLKILRQNRIPFRIEKDPEVVSGNLAVYIKKADADRAWKAYPKESRYTGY